MDKVGINGIAGRIGKFAAYEALGLGLQVVAANDLATTDQIIESLSHKDSMHGKLDWKIEKVDDNTISINGQKVRICHERDPSNIRWGEEVSIVDECTGLFTTRAGAEKHLANSPGLYAVIVSAPGKNMNSYAMGVNHQDYNPAERVISNASCTTKAIAVPLKVLIDNGFQIYNVKMNTVHAATNTQKPLDFMDSYGVLDTIGSAKTGAAVATSELIPSLEGKLRGLAYRVPTRDGSIAHVTVIGDTPYHTSGQINDLFSLASKDARYCGRIFLFEGSEIASPDIIGNAASSIIAVKKTESDVLPYKPLMPGFKPVSLTFVSGYDNERGPAKDLALLTQYVLAQRNK